MKPLSHYIAALFFLAFLTSVSLQDDGTEKWPVADEDGYYKAYKDDSRTRWVNWWARNRPGVFSFISRIWMEPDRSGIPSDEGVLSQTLPIRLPYWLNHTNAKKAVGAPGARVTWLGHATVLAEVDGAVVLTDPIFSQRASLFQWIGPKRYRPVACIVDELPAALNAVVISHNHFDHLDYNSVTALHRRYGNKLHWYIGWDMSSWFINKIGVPSDNLHEMVWWDELAIPNTQTRIVFTPSNHWTMRGPLDQYKTLWGSWAVIGPTNRFWFGGDTAYADVFKQIGKRYGPFNIAAIPIGAYEPRWFMKHVHVNPEEAVSIHEDIGSRRSVGIHWGTFKMTFEPYLAPRSDLKAELDKKSIPQEEFVTVDIGDTVEGV